MGTVDRDLYNTTHTHIYAYYYTYTTEGMNMQLCWLYLLFLMFTEDWFWPIARWHDVWRLMDVYWPRAQRLPHPNSFVLAEHTQIWCANKVLCVLLWCSIGWSIVRTPFSPSCANVFFWLCEKMRMKSTRKSIHSSPNMSKLKNISSSYCWVELTYNSVTLNSLSNIVVSLLKLLHS